MKSEQPEEGQGPSPRTYVEGLVQLLDVQPTGTRHYRGIRKAGGVGRVYGGQVVAQALAAAIKTVDEARAVHSLHAYFLRGGSEDHEIDYRVEADFDGGSFSNRRVIAVQQGEVILNLAASFHKKEGGHFYQAAAPDVPRPDELEDIKSYIQRVPDKVKPWARAYFMRPSALEMRCIGEPPFAIHESREPQIDFWFRAAAPLIQPQWMHRVIMAYASDLALIATAARPHGPFDMQGASLDHSIWFHQDVSVDEWLLYSIESPWSGEARGLGIGRIYDEAGRLVATVAQEGLMRERR